MSLASHRIGNLVMTLQDCFLENPGVALSSWQAEQLCGAGEMTCRAILNLLAEGGVIARTADGRYVRRLSPARKSPERRGLSARAHLTLVRPGLAG